MVAKKRGQGGSGADAAILLAIIAGLIILYIVFLPVAEREELLGTDLDGGSSISAPGNTSNNLLLLDSHPGSVDYVYKDRAEHQIPSTYLITKTAGGIVEQLKSLTVSRGLFSNKKQNFTFTLTDLQNTKDVLLNFQVAEHSGKLMIRLNGNLIFDQEISTRDIEPIVLQTKNLNEINAVEFEAESPGAAFWVTNKYSLNSVTVTADVEDVSARKSKDTFILDEEEKRNIKTTAKLRFLPECTKNKVGKLYITINEALVYSGVPDCGTPFIKDFSADRLLSGENTIEFDSDYGSYFLDKIFVLTYFKESRSFVYDFIVKKSIFDDFVKGRLNAYLILEFPDDEYKEAELSINGHVLHLSTRDQLYIRKITELMSEDDNFIKVTPRKSMYINKLRVEAMTPKYYDDHYK